MSTADSEKGTVDNAIKLVGEAFVPGASLLLDGKIASGVAHLVVGIGARMALGPIGWGIVIANSYTSSVTGKNLLKQFTRPAKATDATQPAASSEPAKTASA